ncbi:MAG: helix-turn-helix transcriptional regulator [Candidatus Riflebacteria bacterium]|nr:helix-turn-helix transcriptional regulator [Candidatus Riflebacteria bacterium]
MKFKEKLKKIMLELGLTQKDIALKAKVSQNTVSKWLRLDSSPKLKYIQPLAKALNIRVSDLTGEIEDSEKFTPTEKRFLSLSHKQQEFLMGLLDYCEKHYIK